MYGHIRCVYIPFWPTYSLATQKQPYHVPCHKHSHTRTHIHAHAHTHNNHTLGHSHICTCRLMLHHHPKPRPRPPKPPHPPPLPPLPPSQCCRATRARHPQQHQNRGTAAQVAALGVVMMAGVRRGVGMERAGVVEKVGGEMKEMKMSRRGRFGGRLVGGLWWFLSCCFWW